MQYDPPTILKNIKLYIEQHFNYINIFPHFYFFIFQDSIILDILILLLELDMEQQSGSK